MGYKSLRSKQSEKYYGRQGIGTKMIQDSLRAPATVRNMDCNMLRQNKRRVSPYVPIFSLACPWNALSPWNRLRKMQNHRMTKVMTPNNCLMLSRPHQQENKNRNALVSGRESQKPPEPTHAIYARITSPTFRVRYI